MRNRAQCTFRLKLYRAVFAIALVAAFTSAASARGSAIRTRRAADPDRALPEMPRSRSAEGQSRSAGRLSLVARGGESGVVVAPGSAADSPLFQRITDESMPPKGELALTSAQIEVIRAWIDGGAPAADTSSAADETSPKRAPPIESIGPSAGRCAAIRQSRGTATAFARRLTRSWRPS